MVKIELDIEGISWYIETTLETDTVPAAGDIIIVDKDCISAVSYTHLTLPTILLV